MLGCSAARLLGCSAARLLRRADDTTAGNAVTAAFVAINGTQLIGMGETDVAGHATALEVLKRVVSVKGAELNLLARRAMTQKTPLMIAAEAGAADVVQVLLEAGADPNTMNGGKYTALDYAVDRAPGWSEAPRSNRVVIVRALLAKGARKDRKPMDGVMPLERAREAGFEIGRSVKVDVSEGRLTIEPAD